MARLYSTSSSDTPANAAGMHRPVNVCCYRQPEAGPATGHNRVHQVLTLSRPSDHAEREAHRVANSVETSCAATTVNSVATGSMQIQPARAFGSSRELKRNLSERILAQRGGEQLPRTERRFFENRLGNSFDDVRIHRDATAAKLASSIGARAFTLGRDITFANGTYAPATPSGRQLLAHELTHVIQQQNSTASGNGVSQVQRELHHRSDDGGRYTLDDEDCSLAYRQNWYFQFDTNQTPAERLAYMEAARLQIENVWSGKFPLLPEDDECACNPHGISVAVTMNPFEGPRRGRGFSVTVTPTELRGFTNPALQHVDVGTIHDTPLNMGSGLTQQRIAHEFGHTIGLTDEYNTWAELFFPTGARDRPSIMHDGDEVRPRHYQPFADMVNFELGPGCRYWPNGIRQSQHANPVVNFSGVPFTFTPDRADFVFGLQYDRLVSLDPLLGLFYPTIGAMALWNTEVRTVSAGPIIGLRLSQIAHPLFVNVRTGVLFDPSDPEASIGIRVPLAMEVGMRTEGFEIGVNYTPIANILGAGGWTHLIGVGGRFDFPWERSR